MTKIFITGATGYIGGDALFAIVEAHPEYEITALVRNSDKGAQVASQYAKVKLVYGDLDDADLLSKEVAKADIVCHLASADHEASAKAIVSGLLTHSPDRPGFFIHTSGTGMLMFKDLSSGTFGEASDKVYDDLEGVAEVTSLPDHAPHRNVDKIVLAAGKDHSDKIKTAIICPPMIYGPGRGPSNQRSVQLPDLCKATINQGHGVKVGAGKAKWGGIHVHDLSNLYLRLVEEAAAGGATAEWADKPAVWGPEGYFFVSNGEFAWGDVAALVAKEARKQGFIQTDEVKSVGPEEANKLGTGGSGSWGLWGYNSRAEARRAKVTPKWEAKGAAGIEEEIKRALGEEARALGVKSGHAKVAAGDA